MRKMRKVRLCVKYMQIQFFLLPNVSPYCWLLRATEFTHRLSTSIALQHTDSFCFSLNTSPCFHHFSLQLMINKPLSEIASLSNKMITRSMFFPVYGKPNVRSYSNHYSHGQCKHWPSMKPATLGWKHLFVVREVDVCQNLISIYWITMI